MTKRMWLNLLNPLNMFRINWNTHVTNLGRWNSVIVNKNTNTSKSNIEYYGGNMKQREMWEIYVDMANHDNCCCSKQDKSIVVYQPKQDALIEQSKI
jgi:hypothetical protein